MKDLEAPTTGRIPSEEFKTEFAKIFLSVMDTSMGLHQAKIDMTRALLQQGVKMNMQDMFAMTDLLVDRLQRIFVVKNLAPMLGLVGEIDNIISREMDLIYASRPSPVKTQHVINGDASQGNN